MEGTTENLLLSRFKLVMWGTALRRYAGREVSPIESDRCSKLVRSLRPASGSKAGRLSYIDITATDQNWSCVL